MRWFPEEEDGLKDMFVRYMAALPKSMMVRCLGWWHHIGSLQRPTPLGGSRLKIISGNHHLPLPCCQPSPHPFHTQVHLRSDEDLKQVEEHGYKYQFILLDLYS